MRPGASAGGAIGASAEEGGSNEFCFAQSWRWWRLFALGRSLSLRLAQRDQALLCGKPVFGRKRLDGIAGEIVPHGIRLGAGMIISFGMQKRAGGATQRHDWHVRFQKRTDFIPEAKRKRTDRVAGFGG